MKMIEPNHILEELVVIHVGIRLNIIDKQRLVEFTDELITREDNPDYLFVELSSAPENELIDILGSYIDSRSGQVDTEKLLSITQFLYSSGELNGRRTATLLYNLNNQFSFSETMGSKIHRLDDQYHLVLSKTVDQTIEELDQELSSLLECHKDDSLKLIILKAEL